MLDCPYCAEAISAQTSICPFCKADVREAPVAQRSSADDRMMRMLLPVGRSGWAIAAGYLGLLSFVMLPAPISLIVSIIAIRDLKINPQLHGMGRAVFGLVMGILGTFGLALLLLTFAAKGGAAL